jgi:hypothetical protein
MLNIRSPLRISTKNVLHTHKQKVEGILYPPHQKKKKRSMKNTTFFSHLSFGQSVKMEFDEGFDKLGKKLGNFFIFFLAI